MVLGGGGVWGVAWMTGLATGLAEAGLDLRQADGFVGTSAGSVVSTQLACGLALAHMYARQTDPARQPRERTPKLEAMAAMAGLMQEPTTDFEARARRMGEVARRAETILYVERRADIVERLGPGAHDWPRRRLRLAAVDAGTGELRVFDRESGVPLVDAVAASCAVPGVWPVTPIHGREYIDGGVWKTAENAHLAAGAQAVLIVSPMGTTSHAWGHLKADVAALEQGGSVVFYVEPDAGSAATRQPNLLDPSLRAPAAEAGLRQGRAAAEAIGLAIEGGKVQ